MLVDISKQVKLVVSATGFTFCNCVFIDDDVKAIVDTGADKGSLDEIKPESVDLVINTHHHVDHIRGNHYFSNAELMIHALDYTPLTGEDEFLHYNSIDLWGEIMPGLDYNQCSAQIGIEQDDIKKNFRMDKTFQDKDVIDLGRTSIEILHTPGHSAGHCVAWFPNEEFLFSGDICLTKAGPWYGEVYANPDDLIGSINKLIELKPRRLTSCHVNDIYEGEEVIKRLIEYRDRINQREERIYKYLLKNTANLDQITEQKLIYRMHPTAMVVFWEKLMLLKHLERLQLEGKVEKVESDMYKAV